VLPCPYTKTGPRYLESDSGPSFPVVIPTNLNGRAALGSEGDHLVGKRLAEPLQVEGVLGYERLVHQLAIPGAAPWDR